MAEAQQYRVTVTNEFRSITSANRLTAEGLSIPQDGDGITTALTKEQLAEAKADQYLTVKRVSPAQAETAAQRQADKDAAAALAADNLAKAKAANSAGSDQASTPSGDGAGTTPAAPSQE